MNRVLEINNLKTYFFTQKGEVPAVDGVDLYVDKGEVIGVVGESGCGKSVTAMSILQLVTFPGKTVDGEIILEGEDLLKKPPEEMYKYRGNKISMIFQEPMTSLNPVYTVGKQVSEILRTHTNDSKQDIKKKVIEMFKKVGIPEPEKRFHSYPHQLSGGLRQRAMIAMAMICNPVLMIADEPTTALDVTIEAQILYLMKELQEEQSTSIILITHNLGIVAEICDRVYVMYAGKIVEEASVFDLFSAPSHPYTRGLLESIPRLHEGKDKLHTIKGIVPNLLSLPRGCSFCPRCENAMKICAVIEPPLIKLENGHHVRCFLYDKELIHGEE